MPHKGEGPHRNGRGLLTRNTTMTRPTTGRREKLDAVLEKRGALWFRRCRGGGVPLTPAEMREFLDPPITEWTEADLLRELVRRFRWTWVGKDTLQRYNPFQLNFPELLEEEGNG